MIRWTSPGWLLRYAWLCLRIALLEWRIWSDQRYLRQCTDDGLVHSLSVPAWYRDVGAMRGRLACLRNDLARMKGVRLLGS